MDGEKIKNDGMQLISKYRTPLMGVAALLIYVYHEWQQVLDPVTSVVGRIESYISETGFFGVDIFFFVSGMGLVYAIGKHSLQVFYLNRLKRIAVPFLAVACVRAVVEKWPFIDFIRNITGVNFYLVSIYSYLWFVVAICTLYFLFPLYYKAFSSAQSKTTFTIGVILALLLLALLLQDFIRDDFFCAINRIPIFLVGVLIGHMQKNKQGRFYPSTWVVMVLCLLLGLYLIKLTIFDLVPLLVPAANCYIPTFLLAFSSAFLLPKLFFELESHTGVVGKLLLKVLSFYGGISLEFYCVQEFVGAHIIGWLNGAVPNVWLNPILFAAATLVAVVLMYASRLVILAIEKTAARIQAR